MSVNLSKTRQATYGVTIAPVGDDWVVTVRGTAHRYPIHGDDMLPTVVRRAVTENYRVVRILSVVRARVGAYIVTAEVF